MDSLRSFYKKYWTLAVNIFTKAFLHSRKTRENYSNFHSFDTKSRKSVYTFPISSNQPLFYHAPQMCLQVLLKFSSEFLTSITLLFEQLLGFVAYLIIGSQAKLLCPQLIKFRISYLNRKQTLFNFPSRKNKANSIYSSNSASYQMQNFNLLKTILSNLDVSYKNFFQNRKSM